MGSDGLAGLSVLFGRPSGEGGEGARRTVLLCPQAVGVGGGFRCSSCTGEGSPGAQQECAVIARLSLVLAWTTRSVLLLSANNFDYCA